MKSVNNSQQLVILLDFWRSKKFFLFHVCIWCRCMHIHACSCMWVQVHLCSTHVKVRGPQVWTVIFILFDTVSLRCPPSLQGCTSVCLPFCPSWDTQLYMGSEDSNWRPNSLRASAFSTEPSLQPRAELLINCLELWIVCLIQEENSLNYESESGNKFMGCKSM